MSALDWWGAPEPRLIRVWARCEYDDGEEPSEVSFIADPSLGRRADEVHRAILRLLNESDESEIPAVGERAIPLARDTLRLLAVW